MRYLFLPVLLLFPVQDNDDKIDPTVTRQLERRDEVDVILLGKTQLLEMPDGFAGFCKKFAKRKRSDLRKETVKTLKDIAKKEQKKILEALGSPENAVSLWIVNAIAVKLSKEKIEEAAKLDEVMYVYPGHRLAAAGDVGQVAEVLEAKERKAFDPEGKDAAWDLTDIGVDKVWKELKITGEGTVVAMLDAGINYLHEDLKGNIWINKGETANDGKDNDKNGIVDDYYGFNFQTGKCAVRARGRRQHGTWTSGIVAGDGTGGKVTGVAPRAKIMALMGFNTVFAAQAWQYALENGADIVNMSFSIPNLGNTRGLWRLMAEHAVCAGLVLISGAGNFQQQQKTPVQQRIPEGIPCVISAGGVDKEGKVPRFCSLGPVEWASVKFYEDHPMPKGLIKPDVCGFPGPHYPVLAAADEGYIDPNNRIQGNSFSSPHIAGVVALMLSANPEITPWRVKEILEETAKDLGKEGKDNRTGAGLVDAYAAVKAAKD